MRFLGYRVREIPNIDPYIYIDKTQGLENKILSGDLDFAITEGQISNRGIKSTIFSKDNLICVAGKDYQIPNKISILDLDKYDFLRREKGSASRKVLDSVLLSKGVKILKPRMESVSNASIIAMLKANLGIAIMPKDLIEPYLKEGELKQIELDTILERRLSIICHKNKSFSVVGKKAYNLCLKYLKK